METQVKLKKSVRIKMQKEAQKQFKKDNQGHLGEASAYLKNVPTSPRKMRLVADVVRGMNAFKALGYLKFESKIGARYIEKLLESAIKNWELANSDIALEDSNLYVKTIFVDCGRMLKRIQPAPQGRAHRVRKRSNHITLVVDSKPMTTAPEASNVSNNEQSEN